MEDQRMRPTSKRRGFRLVSAGLSLALLMLVGPSSAHPQAGPGTAKPAGAAARSDRQTTPHAGSELGAPTEPGPGPRIYKGRPIADVMSYLGADWLIRPDREETEQPEKVLDALELKPGDVVADLGCGVGYFTLRIARRVKPAAVLAVEIQPEMLRTLKANMKTAKVSNIEPILGGVTDPKLPAGKVDLVLMVDVYHEFSHPVEMMAAIRRALKPGGRCVLVEYRAEDPKVQIKPEHKMTLAQVKKEIVPLGFAFQTSLEFLPNQHVIIFTKPAGLKTSP